MDNNKEEENGFGEEDDDFEFGGFEAADPVDPNVAQNANAGQQGGPNPWASMFSAAVPGGMNVQPDLLCGQNRFPQHLDNPLTVDVAGSAEASIPVPQEDTVVRVNGAGNSNELDFNLDADDPPLNLDHINMANDILDGSFRSNQSGASGQLPDISGLDLALGVPNVAAVGNETENLADLAKSFEASNTENQQVPSPFLLDQRSAAVPNMAAENQVVVSANQRTEPELESANQQLLNLGLLEGEPRMADAAAERNRNSAERESLKEALEKQLSENAKLTEDLNRAHELAESAKSSYDKLQSEHEKQLEGLRAAGHESLAMVVKEYKELVSSTVAQQQESWQHIMIERLKEESVKFRELLQLQKDEFDAIQREERARIEQNLKETTEEMRAKLQEQFEKQLAEERKESAEKIAEAMKTERDASVKEMEKMVEDQQRKAEEMLEKEKEAHRRELAEQVVKSKEEMEKALQEQQKRYQTELSVILEEERTRGREAVRQSVQATRDEMKAYLQQQRQSDRAAQRRQLASLDLFLESARLQLSTLMSTDQSADHSSTSAEHQAAFTDQKKSKTDSDDEPLS